MTSKLETLSRVFFSVSILSFVVACGGCIACLQDSKTESREDFYVYKGEVRSHMTRDSSGGEGFAFLLPLTLIAAGVCAISLVVWTQVEKRLEEPRRKALDIESEAILKHMQEKWAKEMEEKRVERET